MHSLFQGFAVEGNGWFSYHWWTIVDHICLDFLSEMICHVIGRFYVLPPSAGKVNHSIICYKSLLTTNFNMRWITSFDVI
jgi:hypothetical protein